MRVSTPGLAVKLKIARGIATTTSREVSENILRRRGTNQTQTAVQRLRVQELSDDSPKKRIVAAAESHPATKGESHMVDGGRKQANTSANSGVKVPQPRHSETQTAANTHVVTQNLPDKPHSSLLTENLIKKVIKEALEEYNGNLRVKSLEKLPPHVSGRPGKRTSFFNSYKSRFFKNMGVRVNLNKRWQTKILTPCFSGSPDGTHHQRAASLRCHMCPSRINDEAT